MIGGWNRCSFFQRSNVDDPLEHIRVRIAADVERKPGRTLFERGFTEAARGTVDRSFAAAELLPTLLRCPTTTNHPFRSRHRIRSNPSRRGIPYPLLSKRGRLAPLANNATLCALYASALLQDAREWSLHPSEGGGNKDWRSWNTPPLLLSLSIAINGNRRSDGVFFQSMARMIGDETLFSRMGRV